MELILSILRRFRYGHESWGLALAVMVWLAVPSVQAQIIYVSDSRSTSAALGVDTNGLTAGGVFSVTYSGDYSSSASPTSPFADFNSSLNGGVNYSVTYKNTHNSYSGSVYATQASSLNALGINYSSYVGENDNFSGYVFNGVHESSSLQVSFMVTSATPYDLDINRGNDPLFSSETWTLTSASLGTLVNGPTSFLNSEGTFNYSGMFSPGDVYTLTLQEGAGNASGTGGIKAEVGSLQVSLAVPEPKSSLLLGMGMLLFFVARHRRKSGRTISIGTSGREN